MIFFYSFVIMIGFGMFVFLVNILLDDWALSVTTVLGLMCIYLMITSVLYIIL